MLAEIIGPDVLVILVVLVLLFGGSQLPKLARSLGTARNEFEKGLKGGDAADASGTAVESSPPASAPVPTSPADDA